ncbi:MAG: hypothetical protein RKL24_03610 [Defluviicoccus sp.]|nr:hypothetical protein [Defluviicoccus sp.]
MGDAASSNTLPDEKHDYAIVLRESLAKAKALRMAANAQPDATAERLRLRRWQAERLARTHADLLENPRYSAAAQFFLSDLYGPKDFSERDDEIERILPTLLAVLPASGVRTVALAIEVDALSEELDQAMVQALRRGAGVMGEMTANAYAEAYRRCGNRSQRELQIALVGATGQALDRLTRRPLIGTALHLMRVPAHMAGLGELHEFLQRGFDAFRSMGGADDFLRTIAERETGLMEQLFAGDAGGLSFIASGQARP